MAEFLFILTVAALLYVGYELGVKPIIRSRI